MERLILILEAVASASISAGLIILLLPYLRAHASAAPNDRSSHREGTPQGGGLGVILATMAVAWITTGLFHTLSSDDLRQFQALTTAALLLAVVGGLDDIRDLSPLSRLVAQCAAVGMVIAMLPDDVRLAPMIPRWIETSCLLIGGIWFVNLTNFMDGIDWMTVAEVVPITIAIILLGLLEVIAPLPMIIATALLGAIIGFAPFNKPVARLFLGDAGSLPIGLVLAWLLLQVAAAGHYVAAVLLPLYYLADATITLVHRAVRRERIWQAHRGHFYQRATAGGLKPTSIVGNVFAVNIGLATLALLAVAFPGAAVGFLAIGASLIAWLLTRFARGP